MKRVLKGVGVATLVLFLAMAGFYGWATLNVRASLARTLTAHEVDIAAGPPDWIPARNLTPHADGLAGWTYEDFERAMREGIRPDGSALRAPMTLMKPYAEAMTDIEMQALWAYLQTVEARPMGR